MMHYFYRMCRKRFSVWCRQATKDKKLVNENLWAHIQAQFPDQVKAALEGEEEAAAEEGNFKKFWQFN